MIDFTHINIHRDTGLRLYQKENKAKIYKFWEKGRSVMLQMPTGTGKTRVFASIARDMHEWGVAQKKAVRILFLAHRKELIDQISETLGVKYNLANGIIAAGFCEQRKLPIQVGSVPTLNRRLDRWTDKDFDIIVIDEAHHTPAESYKKILREFPNSKILGVTATPYRLSGAGFKDIFEDIIISDSVAKFIDAKWLSDYEYFSIKPDSLAQKNIEALKLGFDGDYLESDMENRLDRDHIRAKIVETYLQYANGKKGLVYSINQKHNIHLCAQFEEQGISARAIDSKTSKEERQRIVQDFKSGKFDVLCNVNIFSEGFDCPDVEFIQLARPTKSLSMFLQQVGRGLRTHEGKEKVIFLDNVGLYNRFGLPSANRKWRYHFEGKKGAQEPEIVKGNITGERREIHWIEGEEHLDMVYSTGSSQCATINGKYDEIYDYPIYYLGYKDVSPTTLSIFYSSFDINGEDIFDEIDTCIDALDESDLVPEINDIELGKKFNGQNPLLMMDVVSHSYKLVSIKGKYGILNTHSDKLIIPCIYDEIKRADILGRAVVVNNGLLGIIDVASGKVILSSQYDEIEFLANVNIQDYYIARKGEGIGIVKANDEIIVDFIYDEISYEVSKRKNVPDAYFFNALKDDTYYLITKNFYLPSVEDDKKRWSLIVEDKYYTYCHKGKYGVGDINKRLVLPIIFSSVKGMRLHPYITATNDAGETIVFNYDLEVVGGKWHSKVVEVAHDRICVDDGCINAKGEYIYNGVMRNASQYSLHTCFANEKNKWCALNSDGVVIDCKLSSKRELIHYLYPNEAILPEINEDIDVSELRLVGYYSNHGQTMHQEDKYIYQADCLATNISKSLNDTADNVLSNILEMRPVLIFRNKKDQLFAYFPLLNIARISNVVYNKKIIIKIPSHLSAYFTPGKSIPIEKREKTSTLEPWQDALLEYKSQLPPPISKRQQKMKDRAERERIETQKRIEAQKAKQEKQEADKQAIALKYASYVYNNYEVSYSKSDKLWIATNNLGSSYFGESKEAIEKLINKK